MRISTSVIENRETITEFLRKLKKVDYHYEPTSIVRKTNFVEYAGIMETCGNSRDIGLSEDDLGVFIENPSPIREAIIDVILIFLHALTRKGS